VFIALSVSLHLCLSVCLCTPRLAHGVGRSGDIAELQPKAAGSSLMAVLARALALDWLRTSGVVNVQSCLVLPVATGMALVLVFLALRARKPNARYILWPRIDQKSCFKSILAAGACRARGHHRGSLYSPIVGQVSYQW
jgi:O-phosphoseryl-tRNA(Sec) selenium transferase